MQKPLITVIMPVFNSEKYLKKALDSLIYQIYDNLEIITIDDASTDSSYEILKEYQKKDKRIKLFKNDNPKFHKGAAFCRNIGLDNARGDYIAFLDSDDWVFLTLYEKFVELLNKNESEKRPCDIYVFNYSSFIENFNDIQRRNFVNISDWKNHASMESVHTFKDFKKFLVYDYSVCNKIFKKEFLTKNNIKFEQDLIYEDVLFSASAFIEAKSILVNDKVFARYRNVQTGSVTSTKTPKVFDIFKISDLLETKIRMSGNFEVLKYALFQFKFINYFERFRLCPDEEKEKYFDEMKRRLIVSSKDNLDLNICSKLNRYNIFERIKNTTFDEFQYLC